MFEGDYCAYPPQIGFDVEVTEPHDGERLAYVVGSATVGRYVLLRPTEHLVLQLLGASLAPAALCDDFRRKHGGRLSLAALNKFLARLDEIGVLAGMRTPSGTAPGRQPGRQFYVRFKLFNPDCLFARMVPFLRWFWTPGFVITTIFLMLLALLLSLRDWAELTSYSAYLLREHYVAAFLAGTLVVFSHEFAHGLTCKAFGGRSTEVGVLLVFYFLPALYCNVSGLHLIPQSRRRLWVILAGVYWLLVGTAALLTWFVVAPHSVISQLAFLFFLGSVLNVAFNANPLIKLDGYYFLSQALRLPNLMARSRAYWHGLWRRLVSGERHAVAAPYSRRERAAYAIFGFLSTLFSVGLIIVLICYVGGYLIDSFNLPGLVLTGAAGLMFMRGPLKQMISTAASMTVKFCRRMLTRQLASKSEAIRETNDQGAATTERGKTGDRATKRPLWRRSLVPLTIFVLAIAALLMPWEASVGSYGTLIAIPGQEAVIRAPESATLVELRAQPGEFISGGSMVGRLGNLELDEQIVQVQSELVRAKAEYDRLLGELRVREELAVRAEAQLRQRRYDYEEIDAEQRQINQHRVSDSSADTARIITASFSPAALPASNHKSARFYPAAIAVLQADVELRRAQLAESDTQLKRARQLFSEGLLPRSELETAETRSSTLTAELDAARERLEAALIDHRRKHTSIETDMRRARSDFSAESIQVENLEDELRTSRALIDALEQRRILLERKLAQFQLTTPRKATVFGEELPRMLGQYFQKGEKICRVADTSRLLVRIQVTERQIGDVRVGYPVRLKTASFPDQRFRGRVSKMSGESEQNQFDQRTYRVELVIENSDGLLRPGMTAFARIDFGRQMIGRILLHKIKQLLRPELWML
jgi:hypothetical protein